MWRNVIPKTMSGGDRENWLFFGDFVRLHILFHAAKNAISGREVMDQLFRHGYRLRLGKVHAVLQALEKEGFLTCSVVAVSDERRKYYRTTARGQQVIESARTRLVELAAEVLGPSP
jgi:DNA-binding PadR family transcriptional regulator